MNKEFYNVVILIPSYQPDEKLTKYVNELIDNKFRKILIVNDGSDEKCNKIFDELKNKEECIVLEHEKNMGKGKALKTGFEYYINNIDKTEFVGIVTADSDGQHSVKDTIKIAESIDKNKNNKSIILGVRNFNKKDVPFRSKFGNNMTSFFLKVLYGAKIQDTQTGLRGFTNQIMEECLEIKGDRYEYETNMLLYAINKKIDITQIEIETIYIEDNKSSHFNPIKDSFKIYKLIFGNFIKFSMSGIISFIIDYLLFLLFANIIFKGYDLKNLILVSTVLSRVISSAINFTLNKTVVFNNKGNENTILLIVKYYTLCIVQMLLSAGIVYGVCCFVSLSKNIVKIIIDLILFFVSYKIQKEIIFKKQEK